MDDGAATPASIIHFSVADKKHWRQLTVTTPDGELEYTLFPGPQPFIGATRLAGTPIAPADAHVRLVELGHEHAVFDFVGNLRFRCCHRSW